jgi:hypothetical protein
MPILGARCLNDGAARDDPLLVKIPFQDRHHGIGHDGAIPERLSRLAMRDCK